MLSSAALLLKETEEIQITFTNGKFLLLMIIVWGLIVQKQLFLWNLSYFVSFWLKDLYLLISRAIQGTNVSMSTDDNYGNYFLPWCMCAGAVRASSIFPILSVILLFMGGLCIAASEFYKSRHNIILSAGILFVSAGIKGNRKTGRLTGRYNSQSGWVDGGKH